MKIETGDLFDPAWGFQAIAHGVNLKGVMGAGVAAECAMRWPKMKSEYVYQCESQRLRLGSTFYYFAEDTSQMIYNIASQEHPGPDARLDALAVGLHSAMWHAGELLGMEKFGVPMIGAGIGGLGEDSVLTVMEQVAILVPEVELTVVKYAPVAAVEVLPDGTPAG